MHIPNTRGNLRIEWGTPVWLKFKRFHAWPERRWPSSLQHLYTAPCEPFSTQTRLHKAFCVYKPASKQKLTGLGSASLRRSHGSSSKNQDKLSRSLLSVQRENAVKHSHFSRPNPTLYSLKQRTDQSKPKNGRAKRRKLVAVHAASLSDHSPPLTDDETSITGPANGTQREPPTNHADQKATQLLFPLTKWGVARYQELASTLVFSLTRGMAAYL